VSDSCPRLLLLLVLLVTGRIGSSAERGHDLANLERSFWLHASLAGKDREGNNCPISPRPRGGRAALKLFHFLTFASLSLWESRAKGPETESAGI
jgi:hypothetical protein